MTVQARAQRSAVASWARGRGTAGRGAGVASAAARILELQRTAGNRAVSQALAGGRGPAVQRAPDASKPDVVSGADRAAPRRVTGFVGLNPGAKNEAAGLEKRIAGDHLRTSLNNPAAEKVLKEDPAVFDFVVDELGIDLGDFRRWDKATDLLLNADPHLREQLADVMRWMNQAEKGEIVLERLVLSGHSNGAELWGEYEEGDESRPGVMLIERDLANLSSVFPGAVGQVESIMFSACFSINAVEIVKKVFPNLKSVWSYGGFSPSAANGSIEHILTWELATRDDRPLGKGLKRGSNALWTKEKGYVIGDPSAAAAGPLYAEVVRGWREVGEPYYDGKKEASKSALDAYYVVVQRLIAHPGAAEDLKAKARKVLQAILIFRHWPQTTERFGQKYGDLLKSGYAAVGKTPPDWSRMSRTELRAHVEMIRKLLETNPDASFKANFTKYVDKGLFQLDPDVIKSDWF